MARIPEELYKKELHDPDNHDGVITDLEPDKRKGMPKNVHIMAQLHSFHMLVK